MATLASNPFNKSAVKEGSPLDIPTIESSFLENFKYDSSTQQLSVTMKNGAQYLYFSVEPHIIEQLGKSPSKGSFYANTIKGKYPGQPIVPKTIGPQIRNPLKGPTHDKPTSRFTKSIARPASGH